MPARTILHTGTAPTAVAVATARRSAAAGHRTLVLSTGPAHALAATLGHALGPEPREVADGLWGLEVSARAELERRVPAAATWLAAGPLPPGAAELAAGLVLAEHALADAWDVVVADCGPPVEALRLLELPEVGRTWVARTGALQRSLAGALRPLAGGADPGLGALLDGGGCLARVLLAWDDVLHDPERCSVRLVLGPGPVAPARRTAAVLALHGLGLDAVVTADGAGARTFAPVPVLVAADPAGAGPAAADRLEDELWARRDPVAVLHAHPAAEVVVGRAGASVRLALPHVERADLTLHRVGGALVVGLGEHRRSLPLPAAVADYRPVRAQLAGGVLTVELLPLPMTPDLIDDLRDQLRATRETAERLAREADAARRGPTPPAGWATRDDPAAHDKDLQALMALVDALRQLVPEELQAQLRDVVRQVLLLVRALIDWWVERVDGGPARGASASRPAVEEIPID